MTTLKDRTLNMIPKGNALAGLIVAFIGGVLLPSHCTAEQRFAGDKPMIRPNNEIQAQIDRAIDAARSSGNGNDAGQLFRELNSLKRMAAGDNIELVRQIALSTGKLANADEALILVKFIDFLEFDDSVIVAALAPYLNADDRVGGFARDCFRRIDKGAWKPDRPLEPVNYSVYKDYIAACVEQGEVVPEPFVVWIYQRLPSYALLAFHYGHRRVGSQQREVLWAEHVVSDAIWRKANGFTTEFQDVKNDAISALQELSINKNWWVRMYVAEIVQQHPEFSTETLHERLSKDEDELVRRTTEGRSLKND